MDQGETLPILQMRQGVNGRRILEGIDECVFAVFPQRMFYRPGFPDQNPELADIGGFHAHSFRNFARLWLALDFSLYFAGDLEHLIHIIGDMHRQADGPTLVDQRPLDCLPDPPGGVGREAKSLLYLKLVDGLDQPHVPFLDQVEKRQAAIHVTFGDFDDQAQIAFNHQLPGVLVPLFDPLPQLPFLLGAQEFRLLQFLKINFDGIFEVGIIVGFRFVLPPLVPLLGGLYALAILSSKSLILPQYFIFDFPHIVHKVPFVRTGRNLATVSKCKGSGGRCKGSTRNPHRVTCPFEYSVWVGCAGPGGVLTGAARSAQEAQEEAEAARRRQEIECRQREKEQGEADGRSADRRLRQPGKMGGGDFNIR